MTTHNANNERIKRKYYVYLKEAKRNSEPTVDAAAKALARFENDTKHCDFKLFHIEQAISFKRRLLEQQSQMTGEKLSKSTVHATLTCLKCFFCWLAGQPGYKSRIQYSDADYFNLSEKDMRVATTYHEQVGPTLEQAQHVITVMPVGPASERRDRALVAFTLLTGARDSAIASVKLKHVNLVDGYLDQDAREVDTKFSKSFVTYFFPVGNDALQILVDWVSYLREEMLWGNDDPLFPSTRVGISTEHQFEVVGLERSNWSSASSIRTIFQDAFKSAGLPYFNPHSIRNTLVRLGLEVCKTPEEFKAWSQNLGHEKVLTTFQSYGKVDRPRQRQIIRALASPQLAAGQADLAELAKALMREMRASCGMV